MNESSIEECESVDARNEKNCENKESEYYRDTEFIPGEIFTPPNLPTGKKNLKRRKNQMAEEAYEVMKSMVNRQEKRDEYYVFGEMIACKIKKLPTEYSKSTVQHLINNISYDELGKYNNPTQQYNYIMPYSQPLQTSNCNQPQSLLSENMYQNSKCTSSPSSSLSYNAPTPTMSEENGVDEMLKY